MEEARTWKQDEYKRFVEYALLGVVDPRCLDHKNQEVMPDKEYLKKLRNKLESENK